MNKSMNDLGERIVDGSADEGPDDEEAPTDEETGGLITTGGEGEMDVEMVELEELWKKKVVREGLVLQEMKTRGLQEQQQTQLLLDPYLHRSMALVAQPQLQMALMAPASQRHKIPLQMALLMSLETTLMVLHSLLLALALMTLHFLLLPLALMALHY
ncbi:hypothetical protein Taro_043524 [Colocasia esculenta]|uniref:Uncharacterized protein n=1 Tax=Colocasia esculenta TaxID=4460 RepID=A0A843WLC7_COLES|nr:hypothetical protein [Colocasia esculenta]